MYKVLLADDEVRVRKRLISLVPWEEMGFQTPHEADNGESALSSFYEFRPDLVITDIRMPGIDGLELIRELKRENANLPVIIISGYDDFEYAHKALRLGVMDYLLKPVEKEILKDILTRIKNTLIKSRKREIQESRGNRALREQWYSALISGKHSLAGLYAGAEELGISCSNRQGRMILFAIDQFTTLLAQENDEGLNLRLSVYEASIKEMISELDGAYLLPLYPDQFLIIIFESKGTDDNLSLLAERVCQFSRTFGEMTLSAGVSRSIDSLSRFPESLLTLKHILSMRFSKGYNQVFTEETLIDFSSDFMEPLLSHWDQKLFSVLIKQNQMTQLKDLVDSLFNEIQKSLLSPPLIRSFIMHIIFQFLEENQNGAADLRRLTAEENIFAQWDKDISLDMIKNRLLKFCCHGAALYDNSRQRGERNIIDEVKDYIDEHYFSDITLKDLGNRFFMNPVYLGQLFKKKTGELFNEYLLKIRIREAALLLLQTDMNVYEICEEVGYKALTHFYRAFKKVHHMTPNEYRSLES